MDCLFSFIGLLHVALYMIGGRARHDIMIVFACFNLDGGVTLNRFSVCTRHDLYRTIARLDSVRLVVLNHSTHIILGMDRNLLLALGVVHRHLIVSTATRSTVGL